ncbi:MAG: hypothetical protein IPK72_13240, partial [Candidatus Eisenbacteria bacterium]|nr:hypothetical protein [Candidatus Eisenbacteria bacterium]
MKAMECGTARAASSREHPRGRLAQAWQAAQSLEPVAQLAVWSWEPINPNNVGGRGAGARDRSRPEPTLVVRPAADLWKSTNAGEGPTAWFRVET